MCFKNHGNIYITDIIKADFQDDVHFGETLYPVDCLAFQIMSPEQKLGRYGTYKTPIHRDCGNTR